MTKDSKTENIVEPIIKQKRGRKSKKDIQLAIEQKNQELINKTENNTIIKEDNITCSIQEITETDGVQIYETGENVDIGGSNEVIQKPGAKNADVNQRGEKLFNKSLI